MSRMGHCPNSIKQKAAPLGAAFFFKAPGSDLLSHGLSHTTIGAGAFHFRVRDGIGWDHAAVSAREAVEFVAARMTGATHSHRDLGRNLRRALIERRVLRNWFESQCLPVSALARSNCPGLDGRSLCREAHFGLYDQATRIISIG